jgi:hypothetical protein
MSIAERHITSLVRQLATQEVVELVHPFAELPTFSAQVYIAECFGFQYAGVRLVGRHRTFKVVLTQDMSPWARERAAVNVAAFGQAGSGGPVPGMHQGSLVPVPEVRAEVDLISTLIRYDVLVVAANRKRLLGIGWGAGVLFVLMALVAGAYVVLLPLAVLMPAMTMASLRVNTFRRAKLARRLTEAGCTQVRDPQGRERYVRPRPYVTA